MLWWQLKLGSNPSPIAKLPSEIGRSSGSCLNLGSLSALCDRPNETLIWTGLMGSEKQLQSMESVAVSKWFLNRLVTKFENMGILSNNGEHWCTGTGVLLSVEAPELWLLEAHR